MAQLHNGQSPSTLLLLCMDQIQGCIDHTVQGRHTIEQAQVSIDDCLMALRLRLGDYYRARLLNAVDLTARTDVMLERARKINSGPPAAHRKLD